ncbi:MAG: hypothetical protein LC808_37200, partial [Actinobacteria bacterium]|nr:hypothetical protein [Actinomycetota bacterium]
ILGCAGEPAVSLSYGGGRLRAWHTDATSTTFCRSGFRKRLGQPQTWQHRRGRSVGSTSMAQASNAPGRTSTTRRDEARRKRIRVLQLRAAGESFDAIAQQVGISREVTWGALTESHLPVLMEPGVTSLPSPGSSRLM